MKKEYIMPQAMVVVCKVGDIITSSVSLPNGGNDNYGNDNGVGTADSHRRVSFGDDWGE